MHLSFLPERRTLIDRWEPLGNPRHPAYWLVLLGTSVLCGLLTSALFV